MKKTSRKLRLPPLLADVPVNDPKQDRLGRLPFAKCLANTIKTMKGMDSFVFALCGAWGSGKSSVMSLVVGQLEAGSARNKPIIVKFNPWLFSGHDELLHAFLGQLGAALGRIDKGSRVKALGSRLQIFGKIIRPLSWVPGATVARDVSDAMEAGGEATKRLGEGLSGDVGHVRSEIDELLKKQSRRIVIVMDDIDRLTAREISHVFLIVKAVADFPNTVYLLAFDHTMVARAIGETLHVDGASYIEKIVQVQVDIPTAGPLQLQSLFLSQLEGLIESNSVDERSKRDFYNLFHDGLKEFFKTPRAVKRLTNVMRVLYPAVQGEVYWPDFLGVAALMVFAPSVYRLIRDNPSRFTGLDQRSLGNTQDETATFHRAWVNEISGDLRPPVSELVQRLFPKVETALSNHGYGDGWESQWRAKLRVCSADCFDRYFQLRVPEGELSEAEFKSLVSILNDRREIDDRIRKYCRSRGPHGLASRAKEFLERASLFAKHEASVDQAKSLFEALLRNGDHLLEIEDTERVSFVPITNDLRLWWALRESLERIDNKSERDEFVEDCFSGEFALRAGTHFLRLLGNEHGKLGSSANRPHDPPLVTEACLDRVIIMAIKRLGLAAQDGSLGEHPAALLIASRWRDFGGESESRDWVRAFASKDEKFVRLLGQARGVATTHSGNDRVATEVPTIDGQGLVSFLDGIELRRRAVSILQAKPAWLSAEEIQTLRLVLETINEDGTVIDSFRRRRRGSKGSTSDHDMDS